MKKKCSRNNAEIIEKCYQDVLKYWTWWRKLLFKIKN